MKALRFSSGRLEVAKVERPVPNGEAVIRVSCAGVCSTDLEIVRGYAGFEGIIGHEFVGVVESSPTSPDLVGKRVVGEINAGCGRCELCLGGDPRHCGFRTVLGIVGRDGAHAEYLALPSENLIEVPDNVPDEQAVFTEPLAAAFGITEQVDIFPETRVAVVGDGKLGLLCAFALSLKSNNTSLIGKHTSKLEIASRRGVEPILLENAGRLAKCFDVVVEASGSESGFAAALDLVRPRGKIVLKSTFHGTPRWEAWRVVVDEITIVGSRCGRFEPALGLLADRSVDVSDLISAEFSLDNGLEAVEEAGKSGVLKVLIRMGH
jgi:threonine dehydrogenase-like Zn-dependent dehydrogenase